MKGKVIVCLSDVFHPDCATRQSNSSPCKRSSALLRSFSFLYRFFYGTSDEYLYIDLLIFPRISSVLSHTSFQRNWIAWHFKMIISIIDHLHQNACEIDYLNSSNNRISVTPEIDLYIGAIRPFTGKRKGWPRSPFLQFIPGRNATGYMTQRPKVMINRGSMRLALRSGPDLPFSEHTRRAGNREYARRRRIMPHANGIWAQRLCSRVHACMDTGRGRGI